MWKKWKKKVEDVVEEVVDPEELQGKFTEWAKHMGDPNSLSADGLKDWLERAGVADGKRIKLQDIRNSVEKHGTKLKLDDFQSVLEDLASKSKGRTSVDDLKKKLNKVLPNL